MTDVKIQFSFLCQNPLLFGLVWLVAPLDDDTRGTTSARATRAGRSPRRAICGCRHVVYESLLALLECWKEGRTLIVQVGKANSRPNNAVLNQNDEISLRSDHLLYSVGEMTETISDWQAVFSDR